MLQATAFGADRALADDAGICDGIPLLKPGVGIRAIPWHLVWEAAYQAGQAMLRLDRQSRLRQHCAQSDMYHFPVLPLSQTLATTEQVRTVRARQYIVPGDAEQSIIGGVGQERAIAHTPFEAVVALAALDLVMATEA
jgi:hypothetical protein